MKRKLLLLIAALLGLCPALLAQKADLQTYIDGLIPSRGEVTEIDLSEFNTTLSKTLTINGQSLRFTNGTLTSVSGGLGKDNPLVLLNGGSLYIANDASIIWPADCTLGYVPVVRVENNGYIHNSGTLKGVYDTLWLINGQGENSEEGVIACKIPSVANAARCGVAIRNDSRFTVSGGRIDRISLSPGESCLSLYPKANIDMVTVSGDKDTSANIYICGALEYSFRYLKRYYTDRYCFDFGDDITVAKTHPNIAYSITEEDLSKIELYDVHTELGYELYLDKEANAIKVRIKGAGEITNGRELQEYINKIAAAGTSSAENPEVIEIRPEGIESDISLTIPGNTYIKLTGGKITFTKRSMSEWFIENQGTLWLDLPIDFGHGCEDRVMLCEIGNFANLRFESRFKAINPFCHPTQGCHTAFVYGYSFSTTYFDGVNIQIDKPLYFENTPNVPVGTSQLGIIDSKIACEINSDITDRWGIYGSDRSDLNVEIHNSYVFIIGNGVNSRYFTALNAELISDTKDGVAVKSPVFCIRDNFSGRGKIVGSGEIWQQASITGFNSIELYNSTQIYGTSNIECPIVTTSHGIIRLLSAMSRNWNIRPDLENDVCCWAVFGGDYQKPYTLTEDDYAHMHFDLPSGYKAALDTQNNRIAIEKKKQSLQEFIDGLGDDDRGTEDNPVEIPIDDDGMVVDEDTELNDLQAFIDGIGKDGSDNKTLTLASSSFTIGSGSCLTLRNLIVDGCGGESRIVVHGKLVIDVNVYVHGFGTTFIEVRDGGSVIWKGGEVKDCGTVIINTRGTVVIEGGSMTAGGIAIDNRGGEFRISGGTVIRGGIVNGGGGYRGSIWLSGSWVFGGVTNHGDFYVSGSVIDGGSNSAGITNYGNVTITDGTVTGKDGAEDIVTYTDIHICGCVKVENIYVKFGARVYITAEIEVEIRIHLIIDGDLTDGTAIVVGDGYVLTLDDVARILLDLPDGWELKYSIELNAIIICKTQGIATVDADGNPLPVYDLNGRGVGDTRTLDQLPAGIYVVGGKKLHIGC